MPEDTEESGLDEAPTAINPVATEQRNRQLTQPTQSVAASEPAWVAAELGQAEPPTASALPQLDATVPSVRPPTPTPRQRLRVLGQALSTELEKLPSSMRLMLVGAVAGFLGLLLGLSLAPSGRGHPAADEGLVRHAGRLSIPERDAVVRALSVHDTTAALMMLRAMGTKDRLMGDAQGLALRARLSLLVRDPLDALDNLEAAFTVDPKFEADWLAPAVVHTFAANKASRTQALLERLPKEATREALQAACMDFQPRIRRGAQEALKALGAACSDPIGTLMLDAYQVDKCDAARVLVPKLTVLAATDERVGAALDALSRRPGIASCVSDLIPRK